jgi:hypothetical protein
MGLHRRLYYIASSPRFDARGRTPHLVVLAAFAGCVTARRPRCTVGVTAGLMTCSGWAALSPTPSPLTWELVSPAPPLALAIPALASNCATVDLLQYLYPSVLLAVYWLLGALVAFRLTHSRWVAQFLLWLVLVLVAMNLMDDQSAGIMPAAAAGLIVAVIFRFGLLSTAVMAYVCVTQIYLPSTTDPTVWYAGASAAGLAVAVGLAAYGFLVSLAGKPIFGAHPAELSGLLSFRARHALRSDRPNTRLEIAVLAAWRPEAWPCGHAHQAPAEESSPRNRPPRRTRARSASSSGATSAPST